jgi:hypothetical protein
VFLDVKLMDEFEAILKQSGILEMGTYLSNGSLANLEAQSLLIAFMVHLIK